MLEDNTLYYIKTEYIKTKRFFFYFLGRFTKHDGIALCLAILIPVITIILTVVSIVPSLGAPPLPEFQDPIKVGCFSICKTATSKPSVKIIHLSG